MKIRSSNKSGIDKCTSVIKLLTWHFTKLDLIIDISLVYIYIYIYIYKERSQIKKHDTAELKISILVIYTSVGLVEITTTRAGGHGVSIVRVLHTRPRVSVVLARSSPLLPLLFD